MNEVAAASATAGGECVVSAGVLVVAERPECEVVWLGEGETRIKKTEESAMGVDAEYYMEQQEVENREQESREEELIRASSKRDRAAETRKNKPPAKRDS